APPKNGCLCVEQTFCWFESPPPTTIVPSESWVNEFPVWEAWLYGESATVHTLSNGPPLVGCVKADEGTSTAAITQKIFLCAWDMRRPPSNPPRTAYAEAGERLRRSGAFLDESLLKRVLL